MLALWLTLCRDIERRTRTCDLILINRLLRGRLTVLIMAACLRYPLRLYQSVTNYALVFGPSGLCIRSESGLCGPVLKTPSTELFERGRSAEGLFKSQVVEGQRRTATSSPTPSVRCLWMLGPPAAVLSGKERSKDGGRSPVEFPRHRNVLPGSAAAPYCAIVGPLCRVKW